MYFSLSPITMEPRVSYHARSWYVQVASAFLLTHHYRAVLAWLRPSSLWRRYTEIFKKIYIFRLPGC